jgi:hypothetical protein
MENLLNEISNPFAPSRRSFGAMADKLRAVANLSSVLRQAQDERKDAFTPERRRGARRRRIEGCFLNDFSNNNGSSQPSPRLRRPDNAFLADFILSLSKDTTNGA